VVVGAVYNNFFFFFFDDDECWNAMLACLPAWPWME
jgi:hypothetical protein